MPEFLLIISWLIICYLLGTLSLGDMLARFKGVDIRTIGTMNPGATNIYKTIGPIYGIIIFFLDVCKGLSSTLIPLYLFDAGTYLASLSMFLLMAGHLLKSPWSKPGGTGMATTMGACCGLIPVGLMIALLPSGLVLLVTKNTTYTGIFAFLLAIIGSWLAQGNLIQVLSVLMAAGFILLKYRIQYNRILE